VAIDTKKTFIDAYNFFSGKPPSYVDLLDECANNARLVDQPPQNAINNARGAWYAWIIAIDAMKHCIENSEANYLIKLPNARQFDAHSLYVQSIWSLIDDFRSKLNAIGNVNLVTSNPDFVILKRRLRAAPLIINSTITTVDLDSIDEFYKDFVEACELDDVIGHVGAKTSVRPDRRIQLLHEGSLTKAIYAHLQTRLWLTEAKGVKYYAVSLAWGDADIEGLRSVATHSIASASLTPQPAVDDVIEVKDSITAKSFFSRI
jgi:hypothetical protein